METEKEIIENNKEYKAQIKKLNLVIILTIISGVILTIASFIYYPNQSEIQLGVICGALISLFNFWLLKRAVINLIFEKGSNIKIAIQILLKFFIMIALVAFMILKLKVSMIAFVIGFSSLVVSLILVGLSYLF